MVQVKNEKENTLKTIEFSGTVKDLLKKLTINPETVLVIRKDEVLIEDEIVEDDDCIELLNVISGG